MTNDNITNTNDSTALLKEIAENSAKQVKLQKKNLFWNRIIALLISLVFILLIYTYTSIYPLLAEFSTNANDLILQFSVLIEEISETVEQLQELDFEATLNEISSLATESSEKISAIDVETLNTAIEDLSSTVAPFASLFGR